VNFMESPAVNNEALERIIRDQANELLSLP
jgi:hypothetical protein